MLLYGLSMEDKLPAIKMNSDETRDFLIQNNLKEPLVISGDWKWKD
jgi:carboxypeptidase Q